MIQTNNLSYQYKGSEPLVFPDFAVKSGAGVLICGESGCGKTTLLHLLAGLRQAKSGKVLIGEENISKLTARAIDQFRGQHIGIVYQQSYFIQSLTILDNLLISPYAGNKDKAKSVAKRLHIEDFLHRYPYQLSVGQQQRASIARAVMNQPKLLLADEPTSALDNKNCREVMKLLLEEANTNNAALIVVTHDDRLKTEIKDSVELKTTSVKNH